MWFFHICEAIWTIKIPKSVTDSSQLARCIHIFRSGLQPEQLQCERTPRGRMFQEMGEWSLYLFGIVWLNDLHFLLIITIIISHGYSIFTFFALFLEALSLWIDEKKHRSCSKLHEKRNLNAEGTSGEMHAANLEVGYQGATPEATGPNQVWDTLFP